MIMTQSEVNRIIMEKVLRECWHEVIDIGINGENWWKVVTENGYTFYTANNPNLDFSRWEHYGPLLEKIQGEGWWWVFVFEIYTCRHDALNTVLEVLLNPTKGSLTIAEFVKDREVK